MEAAVAAAAKSLQSCPTLCDPIDGSPPGSPVPGILQARTLEWVDISFSNEWKWKVKVKSLSCVWLLATPWTAAYRAPPSMGFSRQEYWTGLPLPSPNKWKHQNVNPSLLNSKPQVSQPLHMRGGEVWAELWATSTLVRQVISEWYPLSFVCFLIVVLLFSLLACLFYWKFHCGLCPLRFTFYFGKYSRVQRGWSSGLTEV